MFVADDDTKPMIVGRSVWKDDNREKLSPKGASLFHGALDLPFFHTIFLGDHEIRIVKKPEKKPAEAGFSETSIISCWLERCETSCFPWLSEAALRS